MPGLPVLVFALHYRIEAFSPATAARPPNSWRREGTLKKQLAAILAVSNSRRIGAITAGLLMVMCCRSATASTISLTHADTAYTQDFNTLANTGIASTLPTGWAFSESGTGADTTYSADNGTATAGNTYSYGSTDSSDRALGGLRNNVVPVIGAAFTNNTGSTITAFYVAYTGEQWRLGASGRTDRLDFQYCLDTTTISSGSWVNQDSLDFSAPISSGTAGALDGNSAANRKACSFLIKNVSIPIGGSFAIRWIDSDVTGADDGLAVDDFSLTPLVASGADIPTRFGKGALLATQTRPTNYGDNQNEIDQLYGTSDGGNLRLGITGNLQNNGNGIIILIDTKDGGSNPFNYSGNGASYRIAGLYGDTLDSGFAPDYVIDTNIYDTKLFADLYNLQGATMVNLGNVVPGSGVGVFSGGGELSFNNTNTAGVTDSDPTSASTATSGLEISLPLSQIGSPTGPIKAMVLLTDSVGNVSNQVLPGLPDTYGGLPKNAATFNQYPGKQYVTMTPAWTANDLASTQLPWTYEARVFTNDSSRDNHPPVVNVPTIYNGRVYAVEDIEHSGGTHTGALVAIKTSDGTVDTTFGTGGRIALDAPATGRLTVRGIGGIVRLYFVDNTGKLYSMDENGGNLRTAKPLSGVTKATGCAVIEDGGVPVAYYGVLSGSGASLVKVTDVSTMDSSSLLLDSATDITASPSVIRGGGAIQISTTNGSGGKVFSILKSMTPINAVSTANPVKAPTTLSSDSTLFYVGDAPGSGNGSFYCFNASTGNQVGSIAINGGLEYAAYADYSVGNVTNALYFVTTTGQVYAVNPGTLNTLAGYPAAPLGGVSPSGGTTVLNGNIYIPSLYGTYIVLASAPTSYVRYPVYASASTPSASGRETGSVLATTSATGLVNALSLR